MKLIRLGGKNGFGKFVIVDDDDFEWLNQWKWFVNCKGYSARTMHGKRPNRIDKTIFMHRLINNTPEDFETDHINRNKLDNRRCNLRTVTCRQNQLNRGLQKNNRSGCAGVHLQKPNQKWWARIFVNKKQVSLGCYIDLKDAIAARKEAELLYNE